MQFPQDSLTTAPLLETLLCVAPCCQQAKAQALVQPLQGVWDFPGLDPPGCSLSHSQHLLPENRCSSPPLHGALCSETVPSAELLQPLSPHHSGLLPDCPKSWEWCPGQAGHRRHLQSDTLLTLFYYLFRGSEDLVLPFSYAVQSTST